MSNLVNPHTQLKCLDYFFGVGIGMFWFPALLVAMMLAMPEIISLTITPLQIIVTILTIPIYWILFSLMAYFYCGGTLKELFSK